MPAHTVTLGGGTPPEKANTEIVFRFFPQIFIGPQLDLKGPRRGGGGGSGWTRSTGGGGEGAPNLKRSPGGQGLPAAGDRRRRGTRRTTTQHREICLVKKFPIVAATIFRQINFGTVQK